MAFLAVGDIHGSASQLHVLLQLRELLELRRPVFLGDYVDGGNQSREVVDLLIRFKASHSEAIFLKGNHDLALLDYLITGDFGKYASTGGISTIRSYCGEVYDDVHASMVKAVPTSHRQFLFDSEDYFETIDYLFSHAGYDPSKPSDRSADAMVRASHQELFHTRPSLNKVSVCGHYFQETRRPFMGDGFVCLDTGCGLLDGPLTAMLLPERRVVQIWPDLRTTTFSLGEN